EANGWIVIRNPMPTIVFLMAYLSQLLRIGEAEAAEELLSAVTGEESAGDPLVIPRGARVADDTWQVSTPAVVGDDCRLHGNVRAETLTVGRRNEVFGSLRARGDVTVGAETTVHGDVSTRDGDVSLAAGAQVRGEVSGSDVAIDSDAVVEGAIRARGETRIEGAAANPEEGMASTSVVAEPGPDVDAESAVGDADETADSGGHAADPADDVDERGGDADSDGQSDATDRRDGSAEPAGATTGSDTDTAVASSGDGTDNAPRGPGEPTTDGGDPDSASGRNRPGSSDAGADAAGDGPDSRAGDDGDGDPSGRDSDGGADSADDSPTETSETARVDGAAGGDDT
ncbi:MAG: acyltransferase, partial [Halobacteriaceae archaeon]